MTSYNSKTTPVLSNVEVTPTLANLNKQISRTIRFRDRMETINKGLKEGKDEYALEMSVFEIETRAQKGNFKFIKNDLAKKAKVFHWNLIKKATDKINRLMKEKADLTANNQ